MMDLPALYAECAPQVHPKTMDALVQVESHGRVLALNVNRLRSQPLQLATANAAVQAAEAWIARGYSVGIGLGQINSRNLAALGLTVRAALDPCANLRGAAEILAANYLGAARQAGEGQAGLLMALSAYNTGSYDRGFGNGYVARYATGYAVPALSGAIPHRRELKAGPDASSCDSESECLSHPDPNPASTHTGQPCLSGVQAFWTWTPRHAPAARSCAGVM